MQHRQQRCPWQRWGLVSNPQFEWFPLGVPSKQPWKTSQGSAGMPRSASMAPRIGCGFSPQAKANMFSRVHSASCLVEKGISRGVRRWATFPRSNWTSRRKRPREPFMWVRPQSRAAFKKKLRFALWFLPCPHQKNN